MDSQSKHVGKMPSESASPELRETILHFCNAFLQARCCPRSSNSDAGPAFDEFHHFGDVGIVAFSCLRFFGTQTHILVQQRHGNSGAKGRPRKKAARHCRRFTGPTRAAERVQETVAAGDIIGQCPTLSTSMFMVPFRRCGLNVRSGI